MRMDGPGKAMNVSELLKEQKLLLLLLLFFFYCASRTTTMPGLSGPAGQQPCPDPVYFIVPVGQQPCLDFSGRQDSNHIRIPLFYCASRTTTMPGLFGPAGQQPYPDPVILLCQ